MLNNAASMTLGEAFETDSDLQLSPVILPEMQTCNLHLHCNLLLVWFLWSCQRTSVKSKVCQCGLGHICFKAVIRNAVQDTLKGLNPVSDQILILPSMHLWCVHIYTQSCPLVMGSPRMNYNTWSEQANSNEESLAHNCLGLDIIS